MDTIKNAIKSLLSKKGKFDLVTICNSLKVSPKEVQEAISALEADGFVTHIDVSGSITFSNEIPKQKQIVLNTRDYFGDDWIRFGAIGDTHLASKYSRLDVLNALYDIYEQEGITTVYHAGNWIDGEARFNKYDLLATGVEGQVDYFIKHYPKRNGIKTYIISGDDHEGWFVQREHINIGAYMEARAKQAGRDDLIDLGYMERDIVFKNDRGSSKLRVIHAGGGSAYAVSYTSQKYVESLQGGEKPNMILVGHYHKFDYSYPREVSVIQVGCTEDQTPFMRKKRIQAMVGGVVVQIKQNKRGNFIRNKVEWLPFYDKKYYKYHW